MKSISLYPHKTADNHGCEAIAYSTAQIISHYTDAEKKLLLMLKPDDPAIGSKEVFGMYDSVVYCPNQKPKKWSFDWCMYQFGKRVLGKEPTDLCLKRFYRQQKQDVTKNCDLMLSIGGDNYSDKSPYYLYAANKAFQQDGAKTVLWGCSVEPDVIDQDMLKDLARYTKVVAREPITRDALEKHGLKNVCMYPDPAFTLPVEADDQSVPENTVGINVSPLIMKVSENADVVREAFFQLAKYILENTQFNIMLIPHVTMEGNDDRTELERLYQRLNEPGRVFMAQERSCCKIKDVISRCRFFIGARTHSTIAAYSTCVPTLVCGYSVKSKGIAQYLFGSYENYVLPVVTLTNGDELIRGFQWLEQHENEIRTHLQTMMPAYIEEAWKSGEVIKELL